MNAFIKLVRAAESVAARTRHVMSGARLTESQFGVLDALLHLGPMCQVDLGRKILKSGGNITLVVDNLEKRGLVERRRDEKDRRYIMVHLTAEGQRLVSSLFPSHVEGIQQEMSILSAAEQEELGRLCRKLGARKA